MNASKSEKEGAIAEMKQMWNSCSMFILLLCILTMSGCSWHTYDKDKPDAYHQYWQNQENRKNSILYPLTEECQQERKGMRR